MKYQGPRSSIFLFLNSQHEKQNRQQAQLCRISRQFSLPPLPWNRLWLRTTPRTVKESLAKPLRPPRSTQRRSKRKIEIEPIRTDLVVSKERPVSEANLSDDDDLMDELQSATVEEAKPIVVSKSPPHPILPQHACDKAGHYHWYQRGGGTPRGMVRIAL